MAETISTKKDNKAITNPKPNQGLTIHYWNSINYFVGLIKSSELKAGLILSFYGILFNFLYQNMERSVVYFSQNTFMYVPLVLWFCCSLISIYFSIRSFIPRIENKYDDNIFFFGDVITKFGTIEDFSETFYNTSTNGRMRYDQLGQQIYINAKIADKKFKNVSRSFKSMALGLFFLLTVVMFYFIMVLF